MTCLTVGCRLPLPQLTPHFPTRVAQNVSTEGLRFRLVDAKGEVSWLLLLFKLGSSVVAACSAIASFWMAACPGCKKSPPLTTSRFLVTPGVGEVSIAD